MLNIDFNEFIDGLILKLLIVDFKYFQKIEILFFQRSFSNGYAENQFRVGVI